MKILEELTLFLRLVGVLCVALILTAGFFFNFGPGSIQTSERSFFIPVPTRDSFSVVVFQRIIHDLLPPSATVAAGTPLAAFSAQMLISLFLAVLALVPFGFLVAYWYLAPALSLRERKLTFGSFLFGGLLFLIGVSFGYFVVIPRMFGLLAVYAESLGIPNYFFIGDFVSTTITMLLASGTVFLLPLGMPLLTRIGLVSSLFWRKHWRGFIVFSLIVTALLTNDGMGMTMLLLTTPLVVCYLLGVGISVLVERFEKPVE